MSTIDVSFSPLTAHVRTARLVALAVARRAGVPEELLDELRLAVGEACSRAVGVHQSHAIEDPVHMRLSDDRHQFTVEVVDRGRLEDENDTDLGTLDVREVSARALADDSTYEMPSGFGLAVISGLVEDVKVTGEADSTKVQMTWPAGTMPSPAT
jgi:anti-sigma regulatory factor (Ser/Thr protein kinase)